MLIPYGIGAYKRSDIPQIRLLNQYVEKVPENPNGVALLPRPALEAYDTIGGGPIRGMFYEDGVLGSALLTVSGGSLYSGSSSLGAIAGSDRVVMAGDTQGLLIATGIGLQRSDGATVSTVSFPDDAGVIWAGFLGGYAFAIRASSRRIYFTLDITTWDALDYVSAEQSASNLVGACIIGDQLWTFSNDKIEIFVLTGISDTPIQAVQGRVFNRGARVRDSIVAYDNTVVWVGNNGIVYRGEGTPVRISDHGIEERIAASSVEDIKAWSFPWLGHDFYVLHLSDGTTCYDAATQQWHDLGSYGRDRWRAALGVLYGTDIIAGDDSTGALWRLSDGVYADGSDPIQRIFSVIFQNNGFIDNMMFDCTTGTAPIDQPPGVLEMRTSRNGGDTWGNWRQSTLGEQGKWRKRVGFRRVGIVDQGNLLAEIRITDPRPSRVSYIRVNEALGGRGR